MKVALVHDYIKEYGGAERVLWNLHELYPEAPIYTAFCVKKSSAGEAFAGCKVVESWLAPLIKHKNLYSPLRFLTPWIWGSFDFSEYDLVITSASWYITRGFKVGPKTKVICYCHTPPRYLYGFDTSIEWQRWWPVRVYALVVGHFLRIYDFNSAQKVDYFIVNSKNVQKRVAKFYRRESTVIYPPVEVDEIVKETRKLKPEGYWLIASRIVGAKGIEMAMKAAKRLNIKLKIVGERPLLKFQDKKFDELASGNVEFVGRAFDRKLYDYYGKCKAFLALARDEDFGMTPVEAMAAGRPVLAFRGGGYLETVVEGKSGQFFGNYTVEGLAEAMRNFNPDKYKSEDCRKQAERFGKEIFKQKIKEFVKQIGV
jgi:glycosyltransferase involved in cell wall biosynthesis